MTKMKVLSDGGGVDSFAMLLDALERGEKPDLVIFADTGDEWDGTYQHLREVVMPLCAREGIPFVWIDGESQPIRGHRTLLDYFEATTTMPTRMSRMCSAAAKIERVEAWLETNRPGEAVEMWVGFEAGEEKRANNDPHATRATAGRVNRFPLMERQLCRCRCVELIQRHGYAVPPKSACVMCPFSARGDFQKLMAERPETFARLERLEDNCKRTKSGKIIRFGYRNGDESDLRLRAWASRPFQRKAIPCGVCGAKVRAAKETSCGSSVAEAIEV